MTGNLNPETGNRNEDLFQWGHRSAVLASKTSTAPIIITANSRRGGKTIMTKVQLMISALEETRTIHWKYFCERFGWDDRTCRAIAEASRGNIISFDGGYVLNRRATDDEFTQANGRIDHQGDRMKQRAQLEREVREQLVGRS